MILFNVDLIKIGCHIHQASATFSLCITDHLIAQRRVINAIHSKKPCKYLSGCSYATDLGHSFKWCRDIADAWRFDDAHVHIAKSKSSMISGVLVKVPSTRIELEAVGRHRLRYRPKPDPNRFLILPVNRLSIGVVNA